MTWEKSSETRPCLYQQDLPQRIRIEDIQWPLRLALRTRICLVSGNTFPHHCMSYYPHCQTNMLWDLETKVQSDIVMCFDAAIFRGEG